MNAATSGVIRAARAPVAAGALVMLFACAALAQSTDPRLNAAPAAEPQPDVPPPPAEPPRRSGGPGLFSTMGRWIDESLATVSSGWSNARDAVGGFGGQAGDVARGAAGAARDAATKVIPATSLVSGRALCLRTANGGPDCQTATDTLCRSKGFTTGSSLHIQAEQKCPVWGWIAGEKPVGQCGTETYVTSAMCR